MNKTMQTLIENFINGNLSSARKQAACINFGEIRVTLINDYGYSKEKAALTAHYLKTGEDYQAACDAE